MTDTGSVRKTPYDIGGQAPYGFYGTPTYGIPPDLSPGLDVPAVKETALYERQDYLSTPDTPGYVNPPFIGVGSSTTAVPSWMNADGTVMRILRGYIRRSWAHPLSEPNLTDAQKATNARLYFMYNPSELTRQYVSYSALAGVATDNPDAPTAGGQQVPALVTMDFELLFDRQEEVLRYPDHPGVLVDLAVFDMLIGTNSTALTTNSPDGKATPDQGAPLGAMATLQPGIDIYLTIVVSPSITFEGRVWAAGAQFQKFSHRMTPTRMSVTLTLQLNYTGPLLPQGQLDAAAQAAAKFTQQINATKSGAAPQKQDSKATALQRNYDGRVLAVNWATQWVSPTDPIGPGGKVGVPYDVPKRCQNWNNDDLVLWDGPNTPLFFDCSSLIWRSLNVMGWINPVNALHLSTQCGDNSESLKNVAFGNSDVWSIQDITFNVDASAQGSNLSSWSQSADKFNHWDPQDSGQPGPNIGDILIRAKGTAGKDDSGHLAFVHSLAVQVPADPLQWQWKILETTNPSRPVHYRLATTQNLLQGGGGNYRFTHIARPHPNTW